MSRTGTKTSFAGAVKAGPPPDSPVKPLQIDVYADIVCPWCYIGAVRLERALSQRPGVAVETRWRPFQLRPEMPIGGESWRAFAEAKFGGWERALRAFAHVTALGEEEGLSFDFGRVWSAPNTVNAHRLVLAAESEGQGRQTALALFKAYFTEGCDLGDLETLLAVARGVGLEQEKLRSTFTGDAFLEEVAQSQRRAGALGVSGVPLYVLGGLYISGAQPVAVFSEALAAAISNPATE